MASPVGFEAELREWIARVYERRAGAQRRWLEVQVMALLDAERRWLVPLLAGVVLGVAALPLVGPYGIWAALGLLYVGALASGVATMRRSERLEAARGRPEDPRKVADEAWSARPPLGVEERARLVRIMNLARSGARPGVRPLLLGELGEARADGTLGAWPFLADLDELLREDAAALAA